jgi:hypothetical protein
LSIRTIAVCGLTRTSSYIYTHFADREFSKFMILAVTAIVLLACVSVDGIRPFANLVDSDQFLYAPTATDINLFAKSFNITFGSFDASTFSSGFPYPARMVVCCRHDGSTSLTCANAPVDGANTLVVMETLGAAPSDKWTAVEASFVFSGEDGSRSNMNRAVAAATSPAAVWAVVIIIILVVIVIVVCCWRRRVMQQPQPVVSRRQLPQLPREDVYAAVPRPGTTIVAETVSRTIDDTVSSAAQHVSAVGREIETSRDRLESEMRPIARTTLARASSGAAFVLGDRREERAIVLGSVVPSTSLFNEREGSDAPAATAGGNNNNKGDDLWVA